MRSDSIQTRPDRRIFVCLLYALLCICLCVIDGNSAFARIRIDIYGPVLVPFPIAITPFSNAGGATADMAKEVRSILVNDLERSGFFKVSGPETFPPGAIVSLKNPDAVDLAPWAQHPAEALVTGGIEVRGTVAEAFFRLFDLVEQSFVTGLKYTAPIEDIRTMAHQIADEITFHLTGQVGVARTKIAFISDQGGAKDLYQVDCDGERITRLTRHESICLSPAWSPDGKSIAYTCFRRRNPDLYVYSLGRRNANLFSSRAGVNGAPAWSPDGQRIALMMRKGDSTKIALIDAMKGEGVTFLTTGGGNEASPAWSPDGQRLAFVSDRSGSPQIYTITVNGRDLTRITYTGSYNASPAWSPLGERIAFSGNLDGHFDIFSCRPDGGDLQRLTKNARNNEDPTWSPDGRFIAFSSDRSGRSHIYCMNTNGANVRQVTSSKFQETEPAWSPYP